MKAMLAVRAVGVGLLGSLGTLGLSCSSGDPEAGVRVEHTAATQAELICNSNSEIAQDGCGMRLWPNGVVNYAFDSAPVEAWGCVGGAWTSDEKAVIRGKMAEWANATHGILSFVEVASGPRVRIHKSSWGGVFPYPVFDPNGADGCLPANGSWPAVHEIGHTIGFPHNMVRYDRDRYLAVNPNVCPPPAGGNPDGYWQILVRCGQDRIMPTTSSATAFHGDRHGYGPFEINSVMQYGTACSSGTCNSSFGGCTVGTCDIIKRGGGNITEVQNAVTPGDASAVAEMYAEDASWQRFRPSPTSDPGPTSPLNYQLAAGVTLQGSPSVVHYDDSESTIALARGSDNRLYAKFDVGKQGIWTTWPMTGLSSDPAVSVRGGDVLEIAAVTGSNVTYLGTWPGNGWSTYSLGAPPGTGSLSAPAVAACDPNIVSVYVIRDAKLWERRYQNGWGGWVARSTAILTGKPAAVSWGPQRYDIVAVRSSGRSVEHFASTNCGASYSSDNLGGVVNANTSPAIASASASTLSVFVTGTNGILFEKKFSTSWGGWRMIGGVLESSSPGAWGGWIGNTQGIKLVASLRERTPVNSTTRGLWSRTYATCPAASSNGANTFCSEFCPCNEGQADCDDEFYGTDCVGRLVCGTDLGPRYGHPSGHDACVDPGCLAPNGTATCHKDCPCGVGGACTFDEQCLTRLHCIAGRCG